MSKISKNEAKKLFEELIQKDIDALTREKSNSIKKHNILKILENVGATFTEAYLHYKELPKETKFKRSIAERIKLRRDKIAEIEKKEKNINNKLFKEHFTNYQSPSDMYKKLRETEGTGNENQVYLIKPMLNKMKKVIENMTENKTLKAGENKKILLNVFFTLIN